MALKGLVIDGKPVETLLNEGIRKGLEKGDAQMARLVHEKIAEEEAQNILTDLEVEIVPYEIADTSMRTIVLKGPDYVIEEIKAALIERENMALLDISRRMEEAKDEGDNPGDGKATPLP